MLTIILLLILTTNVFAIDQAQKDWISERSVIINMEIPKPQSGG
jgi:hypothetical protein